MGSLAYGLVQRAQETGLVEKVGKLFQVCSPSCLPGGGKRKKSGRHLLKGYWVCRGGDACQEWAGTEANPKMLSSSISLFLSGKLFILLLSPCR